MAGSTAAELKKCFTKKSGKGDLASAWCVARPAQVEQWRAQFALGESVPIGGAFAGPFPPLCPYAVACWHEHHRKVFLGHASTWKCRLRFDKGDYRGQGCGGAGRVLPHWTAASARRRKSGCVRKPGNRQRKATLVAKPYRQELSAAYAPLMDPVSARVGHKRGV